MHYTLKDRQGNLTATVHGNTVERLSHDPWGRRRNPAGFGYDNVSHTFDRGFTGHEHLSAFGLVNMDGRVYDPVMSCFLSPDLYTPGAADPRSYNRFAYCMHNPLRYVDPSGWRPRIPIVGCTPTSADDTREIYAYSEPAYEWRDLCHSGIRTEIATAMINSFIYDNHCSIGGDISLGNDFKIDDININIFFRFSSNELNKTLPNGTKGICVLTGLGSSKTYWYGVFGKWGDDTRQWQRKSKEYEEQTGNDFNNSKHLIDFIIWNNNNNSFHNYEASYIPFSEIPEALQNDYVVAACSELITITEIEKNYGQKGHFANVSSFRLFPDGSVRVDFIEPNDTHFMDAIQSTTINYYTIPKNLKSVSFIKYKLIP